MGGEAEIMMFKDTRHLWIKWGSLKTILPLSVAISALKLLRKAFILLVEDKKI
jgi:hypothetical protein